MKISRRAALGYFGLAAAAARLHAGTSTVRPELILHNGNIHTIDARAPSAHAVAIANGRFVAVGSDDDILNLMAAGVQRVDLGGKTVVPGFVDAHLHTASSGLRLLQDVDSNLPSIAAIQSAIRQRAQSVPEGTWIIGFMYDDTKTIEGRPLRRQDLDAAAPKHPVFISHRGGHTAFVNSRTFEAVGIDESTPDPKGGSYERDSQGRLTGRVMELGTTAFREKIPNRATLNDRANGVRLLCDRLVKAGITSVTDPNGTADDLTAYQEVHRCGDLKVRVYAFQSHAAVLRHLQTGVRTGTGDEWVKVGAMKLACDGSISERTAWMSEPYVGRPNDHGILVRDEEQLFEEARPAHTAGWQIGIHGNGDRAIDIVLRVFERLQKDKPRPDARFRIEHCTLINDDLVRRIKAQHVIPIPFSSYVYFHGEKMAAYGQERLNHMFALRSFLDAGIPATMSSDFPPGPYEPMMFLQSAVTRTDVKGNVWGPDQKITIGEALKVATLNGAHACFAEHEKGSIEVGKLADLVVLGRDPMKEDPFSLVTIPIERTMVGGRWMYES